ncbi:hypothetical protein B0H67DRAFT_572389 [Lasiosphaeris hirsuta]|uniref:C2H2-type domain-containing protein n=1 Tax=Lasiosphaeris hirsuta TaxID=260670 RepID=A0AA40B1U6_9PEZI|nr:hypothetical protein B0H67DRAFT_572389 [Lasiosphaeris hirsuta]
MDTSSDDWQARGFQTLVSGVTAPEPDPPAARRSIRRVTESEPRNTILACPFYKLDPRKYHDCRPFLLRRVKDVKQHIQRKHRSPEFYCDRCFITFPTPESRAEHLRGHSLCDVKNTAPFQGISGAQIEKLNKTINRGKSVEDQWYCMWDILFPGERRPKSVHLNSVWENPGRRLLNIWKDRKAEILPQAYQNDGVVDCVVKSFLGLIEAEILSDSGYGDSNLGSTNLDAAVAEGGVGGGDGVGGRAGTRTGTRTTLGTPRPFSEPESSINRDTNIFGESGASDSTWLTSLGFFDPPITPVPTWRVTEAEAFLVDQTPSWVEDASQPSVDTHNAVHASIPSSGPVAYQADLLDDI